MSIRKNARPPDDWERLAAAMRADGCPPEEIAAAKIHLERQEAFRELLLPATSEEWATMTGAERRARLSYKGITLEQWVETFEESSEGSLPEPKQADIKGTSPSHSSFDPVFRKFIAKTERRIQYFPLSRLAELQSEYERTLKGAASLYPFELSLSIVLHRCLNFIMAAVPELALTSTVGHELLSQKSTVDYLTRKIGELRPQWDIGSDISLRRLTRLAKEELSRQSPGELDKRWERHWADTLQPEKTRTKVSRTKSPPRPLLAREGRIVMPADRINKAIVEAFMTARTRLQADILHELNALEARGLTKAKKLWAACPIRSKTGDLFGAVGLKEDPGEAIWELLQNNGALAIKAHFALWARAYAEGEPATDRFITLTIRQFCDDLGFKKKNRAHTDKNKRAARNVFDLLMLMEVEAYYVRKEVRKILRAGVWTQGPRMKEANAQHGSDGSKTVKGRDDGRDADTVSYAPGSYFDDEDWRKQNHSVAMVSEGMLNVLSTENKDKYAVMLGGYLAMMSRMNSYRPKSIRVRTLLEVIGLWNVDAANRPGRMRDKLEKALDRLCEAGIIRRWNQSTTMPDETDPDDFTSNATLSTLAEPTHWLTRWANECIKIEWPEHLEQRGEELKSLKATAIRRSRRRKAPPA